MALHAERVLDRSQEGEVLDNRSVRRHADASADQYRYVIVDPVLLAGSERSVDVDLQK